MNPAANGLFFALRRTVAVLVAACMINGSVGADLCVRPKYESSQWNRILIAGRHGGLPLQFKGSFTSQALAPAVVLGTVGFLLLHPHLTAHLWHQIGLTIVPGLVAASMGSAPGSLKVAIIHGFMVLVGSVFFLGVSTLQPATEIPEGELKNFLVALQYQIPNMPENILYWLIKERSKGQSVADALRAEELGINRPELIGRFLLEEDEKEQGGGRKGRISVIRDIAPDGFLIVDTVLQWIEPGRDDDVEFPPLTTEPPSPLREFRANSFHLLPFISETPNDARAGRTRASAIITDMRGFSDSWTRIPITAGSHRIRFHDPRAPADLTADENGSWRMLLPIRGSPGVPFIPIIFEYNQALRSFTVNNGDFSMNDIDNPYRSMTFEQHPACQRIVLESEMARALAAHGISRGYANGFAWEFVADDRNKPGPGKEDRYAATGRSGSGQDLSGRSSEQPFPPTARFRGRIIVALTALTALALHGLAQTAPLVEKVTEPLKSSGAHGLFQAALIGLTLAASVVAAMAIGQGGVPPVHDPNLKRWGESFRALLKSDGYMENGRYANLLLKMNEDMIHQSRLILMMNDMRHEHSGIALHELPVTPKTILMSMAVYLLHKSLETGFVVQDREDLGALIEAYNKTPGIPYRLDRASLFAIGLTPFFLDFAMFGALYPKLADLPGEEGALAVALALFFAGAHRDAAKADEPEDYHAYPVLLRRAFKELDRGGLSVRARTALILGLVRFLAPIAFYLTGQRRETIRRIADRGIKEKVTATKTEVDAVLSEIEQLIADNVDRILGRKKKSGWMGEIEARIAGKMSASNPAIKLRRADPFLLGAEFSFFSYAERLLQELTPYLELEHVTITDIFLSLRNPKAGVALLGLIGNAVMHPGKSRMVYDLHELDKVPPLEKLKDALQRIKMHPKYRLLRQGA